MKIYEFQRTLPFNRLLKKTFSKILALLIIFDFYASASLFAQREQSIPITGQIADENNKPLEGVTIHVKNSKATTTTNGAGNFSISVPDRKAILVFTSAGFVSQEVTAGSGNMTIRLKTSNTNLEDVVVVGYGTQKRFL